jgi:methionyl-tRNA formyltransferase
VKIVFMGSPDFAVPCLDALLDGGHDVPLVVSQPDRPAGRGRHLAPTAVKAAALERGLAVLTQDSGRAERAKVTDMVRDLACDAVVVTAFGHILREPLLTMSRLGCLNVHFSLLPRWRGVSPVQQAILHGDAWSGVSIMQMDAGVDTGPVLATRPTPIEARETGGALLDRLGELGGALLAATLPLLDAGQIEPRQQNDHGAVYAPKLTKGLSPIRWDRDVITVHNQIRALDPFPGTTSFVGDKLLKIGRAEPAGLQQDGDVPGTVLAVADDGLLVACGQGVLRLLELQAPGRRMLPVDEFLRGFPVQVGQVFTS